VCVLLTVGKHVSLGSKSFLEKMKNYKLEPRFRFADIIEEKK